MAEIPGFRAPIHLTLDHFQPVYLTLGLSVRLWLCDCGFNGIVIPHNATSEGGGHAFTRGSDPGVNIQCRLTVSIKSSFP